MNYLTTERRFDPQAQWIIDVLGLFVDVLVMAICATRHWQTSSLLVQELNVCTVCMVHADSWIDLHRRPICPISPEVLGGDVAHVS